MLIGGKSERVMDQTEYITETTQHGWKQNENCSRMLKRQSVRVMDQNTDDNYRDNTTRANETSVLDNLE